MFDKLVESNADNAEFKNRSRYFMVSSVVVGIIFFSAVVYSLYAADIEIGNGDFDMSRLLAPELVTVPEMEPPREQPRTAASMPDVKIPTRTANVARIDEPQYVPSQVSVAPSNVVARPDRPFVISDKDLDVLGSNAAGPPVGTNSGSGTGSGTSAGDVPESRSEKTVPPPPPVNKTPPVQSLGVINGRAISLPPPPYPATARSMGVAGDVSVQVMIDEAGRVVSSKAINGHPMLIQAAERAAWNAKFSTTYLSKQPVKVTGVIVYRFKKT